MRFDPLLDSFYFIGVLWVDLPGPQVCPTPPALWATEILAPPAPTAITAFVDVNVVPMDTERVLPNQTVLIKGGRITAMGSVAKIVVPPGAVRIDGRGKYLLPGLGDMHVHNLGPGDIRGRTRDEIASLALAFLADGVTSVRHLHEGTPVSQEQVRMIGRGEVPSPRGYLSGIRLGRPSSLGGPPSKNRKGDGNVRGIDGEPLERPDSAAAYVAAARAAGYDIIHVAVRDVYDRQQFPLVDSVLAAARRLGVVIAAHDHERSFGKILALGPYSGSTEHLSWFSDTLGFTYRDVLLESEADVLLSKLPAFATALARAGVWVTPTLNCVEYKYTPSTGTLKVLRQMVKAMQDAGVGLLLSGDDGHNVHGELVALVRAGLTPYQALATGTRNVAHYMGTLDSTGTVAVGKWADLLLLGGNPLQDVRHARELAGVMTAGHWIDREALDRSMLALPKDSRTKSWIRRRVLNNGIIPRPTRAQREELEAPVAKFEELTDSLIAASRGQGVESSTQRLRQRLADELSKMRTILVPEQHETFDLLAQTWLREQARQGHNVTVADVTPVP